MAEFIDAFRLTFFFVIGTKMVPALLLMFCIVWKKEGFKAAVEDMKSLPSFLLEKGVFWMVLVFLLGVPAVVGALAVVV